LPFLWKGDSPLFFPSATRVGFSPSLPGLEKPSPSPCLERQLSCTSVPLFFSFYTAPIPPSSVSFIFFFQAGAPFSPPLRKDGRGPPSPWSPALGGRHHSFFFVNFVCYQAAFLLGAPLPSNCFLPPRAVCIPIAEGPSRIFSFPQKASWLLTTEFAEIFFSPV